MTPDDLEGRAHMMSAALMGATAFQKGLGAIHEMNHPVGAVFNTHHCTTNAVCMPAMLAFNDNKICDRFNHAPAYLGFDGGFDGFCEFVQRFNDSFTIPRTLTEMGVSADRFDYLVAMAIEDPSCGGNPVEHTADGLRGLFRACFLSPAGFLVSAWPGERVGLHIGEELHRFQNAFLDAVS